MSSRLKNSALSSLGEGRKKDLGKSLQEQVYTTQIHSIEAERLKKVFLKLCGAQQKQQKQGKEKSLPKDRFGKQEIIRILTQLNFPYSKPQIEQWIWEVDEDLDGMINQYEFVLMYKRCIFDTIGLQPRNLFNLVQFLMYDLAGVGKITVEDTLELIFVRFPEQEQLQLHIDSIFHQKEKTADGQDREIFFQEYLRQMRIKDFNNRLRLQQERKTVKKIKKKQQDS